MITYTKEEIIPSTIVSRKFGDILNKLSKQQLSKVAVMRNNKIEAVILSIEKFEEINNNYELKEHIEIAKIIQNRESNSTKVDFDLILTEAGFTIDEL